jgi:hypothetical protein
VEVQRSGTGTVERIEASVSERRFWGRPPFLVLGIKGIKKGIGYLGIFPRLCLAELLLFGHLFVTADILLNNSGEG